MQKLESLQDNNRKATFRGGFMSTCIMTSGEDDKNVVYRKSPVLRLWLS